MNRGNMNDFVRQRDLVVHHLTHAIASTNDGDTALAVYNIGEALKSLAAIHDIQVEEAKKV